MDKIENSDDGVYFLSLSLENVRCFGSEQTLDLSDGNGNPARWTVILGDNGIGKTTLLESFLLATIFKKNIFTTNPLHRTNTNELTLLSCFAYGSSLDNAKNNSFKHWQNKHSIASTTLPTIDNGSSPPFNESFFCVAYNANRKLLDNQNQLTDTERWLLDTHHIAKINPKFKNHFELVENTLTKLLPDVTKIDVYLPDENKPDIKVHFLANNIWIFLDDLSLGYQSMIIWVVDLTARLFKFYPDSPNPIAEPAVVLIDEIDIHLHPKWQREIMEYLTKHFTNTQFIVTAHSPLIVQAAEDANIVVLKREGNEVIIHQNEESIQGWRTDQILASDLFGEMDSRSDKYEKLMIKRRKILGKANLTAEDKNNLQKLDDEMGYIPTAENKEDIEAMEIIRSAAKLLREKK